MDPKRILIVDDEVGAARLLKSNLEQTNDYLVRVQNAAAGALAAAEQFAPDLILLDVMMPDQDGGELASCFHTSPQLKHVRLCSYGGRQEGGSASRGGRIGGLPFLAKPADLPDVIACLEQHLGSPPDRVKDLCCISLTVQHGLGAHDSSKSCPQAQFLSRRSANHTLAFTRRLTQEPAQPISSRTKARRYGASSTTLNRWTGQTWTCGRRLRGRLPA